MTHGWGVLCLALVVTRTTARMRVFGTATGTTLLRTATGTSRPSPSFSVRQRNVSVKKPHLMVKIMPPRKRQENGLVG